MEKETLIKANEISTQIKLSKEFKRRLVKEIEENNWQMVITRLTSDTSEKEYYPGFNQDMLVIANKAIQRVDNDISKLEEQFKKL